MVSHLGYHPDKAEFALLEASWHILASFVLQLPQIKFKTWKSLWSASHGKSPII